MKRRLIIDNNAVYEIDEECMMQKQRAERKASGKTENNQRYIRRNKTDIEVRKS